MTLTKPPFRVAILGARGIGGIHAALFDTLGSEICAILGSSMKTTTATSRALGQSIGITPQPFCDFTTLLKKTKPDAVSICTPPELHFEHIITALDSNIPVFCEKPFFWQKALTRSELEKKLKYIDQHPNRRLFVNTSNSTFVKKIIADFGRPENITSFVFRFYTQGPYKKRDIALDLLPHGFSLVLALLGQNKLQNLSENIQHDQYSCVFDYGNCRVEFDFQQIKKVGEKILSFSINDQEFTRIQEGAGKTYRVFLQENNTAQKFEVEDPFHIYIKQFISYCQTKGSKKKDGFTEAASILRLMSDVLL